MTLPEQVGSLRRAVRRVVTARLKGRTDRPFVQLLGLKLIAGGEVQTQSELADRLFIDAPAASRLVSKLEAEGLIRRKEGADRRCVSLQVTRAAQRELAIFQEASDAVDRQVRRTLTEGEYHEAMRLMDQMAGALSALADEDETPKLR